MAYSLSSGESSPTSDIEVFSSGLRCITGDLSLDDFNDVDLSEITEETTLNHSFLNKRFKSQKVKMSSSQITEHMKKISADMIQLNFNETHNNNSNTITEEAEELSDSKITPSRPQTLNLFSETVTGTGSIRTRRGGRNKMNGRVTQSKSQDMLHSQMSYKRENDEARRSRKLSPVFSKQHEYITESDPEENHQSFLTRSASEWSIDDPESIEYCYFEGEMKTQTHVCLFKFIPRHSDEMSLEINDPVHVQIKADDLWYEGINMRTGEKGIFPCYYVQTIGDYLDEFSIFNRDEMTEKFFLYFIGSVEVPCHKGNEVLCQAMHKVAEARRSNLHSTPPAYVCLMIGSHGVKMIDQSELRMHKASRSSSKKRGRLFSCSSKVKQQTHFFQLKNVSFCGHHPRNPKYFAFITRHPTQQRFACHTFVSEKSTREIIECFGNAFSQYFRDYMDCIHPIEDIYIE